MVKQLYESGQLTKDQGQRLLLFCINPGPAFVISSVGHYMLGSSKAGVILFVSQFSASMVLGFLTRFISDENNCKKLDKISQVKPKTVPALVEAVSQSSSGMIAICSWVIIFSSLEQLIEVFDFSSGTKLFLSCVLEITNGCKAASGMVPIPIIAGIIGWSGICAHFQVMASVIKLQMKLKYFITGRIISGAIAVIVCQTLLYFFPIEESVFLSNVQNVSASSSACISVSIGMFFMCLILLFGGNFKIEKIKNIKKHHIDRDVLLK
ncbi:MAG: hypothetical protein NC122_06090 [Faecalibacterium sp.]|nr:hypothetical protein [Ruminococcus sp.]MCM1391631.1 hypothetical protein [Ruminococcus sp.]MCM1485760.1 hypothetical protein [Faecalibacterium sp.]